MLYDSKSVPRIKNPSSVSLTFGSGDTTVTSSPLGNAYMDGESHSFEITIPNWTNDVTASFIILSDFGNVIFTISGLARNATHFIQVSRPIDNATQLRITLSGAPGGSGGTVTIRPYVYL